MPKITRKQQKVFAVNASNNGVFGSLQANDPVYSQDPDAIQGRTAYSNGWNDATYSAEQLPPLEEFQALQYLFSRQIAYLMQEGVPEWNSATTYYKGALVKAVQQDGSFILYASLVDDNTGNAVTDTTKWVITNTSTNFHQGIPNWRADVVYSQGDWVKSNSDGSWEIYESLQNNNLNNALTNDSYWIKRQMGSTQPLLTYMWSDHQLDDVYWLRGDTFSWQSGAIYETAYQHLVDDIDGKTLQTETVGGYTITFYEADDGHKICLADQEATILNLYNDTGVAWYFILDTTNTRFKLPRVNPDIEKLFGSSVISAPVVGDGTALGLTNGTGLYGAVKSGNSSDALSFLTGAYGKTVGGNVNTGNTASNGNAIGITTDPTKSGMVANVDLSPTNSLYSGKKYLYFYVGQIVKSQNMIDVGEISEELNNKLDSDRIQFVSALPANPVPNVLYLIEE